MGLYTPSDAAFPLNDSMAIGRGRILRVGDYSTVQDLVGSKTSVENLRGKWPFLDLYSHMHFIFGGLQMGQVQLHGVSRKDHFVNKIKEAVSSVGRNNDLWGGEQPMASWIGDITPHNPVWLSRMDGHMGLANSVALKLAGISNNTMDPDGGAVVRNSIGEPSGLLIDSAMKLVFSCIPEVSVG